VVFRGALIILLLTSMVETSANELKNLDSKYFSYQYQIGRGCIKLGGVFNNIAMKKSLAEDKNIKITKVYEINNDFARVGFKLISTGQEGMFIFATSIPVCAGLDAYYRCR